MPQPYPAHPASLRNSRPREDARWKARIAELRLLEGAAGGVDVVIPGHGSTGGADQGAHGSTRIART
jgi:hypothetical protein